MGKSFHRGGVEIIGVKNSPPRIGLKFGVKNVAHAYPPSPKGCVSKFPVEVPLVQEPKSPKNIKHVRLTDAMLETGKHLWGTAGTIDRGRRLFSKRKGGEAIFHG